MALLPTKFVITPSSSLFCPLCEKLFKDPVISTCCGHTFCRKCVENSSILSCPLDGIRMGSNVIVSNRAVNGQLEDLLIWCRHTLYRVDSEDEFQVDEDGCQEQIMLGQRAIHEESCLSAWIPCPNSSNHCGKFRKMHFNDHLKVCEYKRCKFATKGCEFRGGDEKLQLHEVQCSFQETAVEWDSICDGENDDGLHAKYLVKAVKNLNERVGLLEKSKDEIINTLEKYNSNVINLSIQVEKLSQNIEKLFYIPKTNSIYQPASKSISDISSQNCRRTVSTTGLNTLDDARSRSSSSAPSRMFSFAEPKIEMWKMPLSFKCVGTFRGHNGTIRSIASKGMYVFSGGDDQSIKVWDIQDKDMKNSKGCIATLKGHTGEIHAICTSGQYLYSAGSDKSIKVWDANTLKLLSSKGDAHLDVIGALLSTGKYIFSGSYSSIKVWRTVTLELLHSISDIYHWVRAFAVSSKRKTVYSGSHNKVHLWSAEEPFTCLGELTHTHGSVYSLAVTNHYLIIGTYNQNTHLYNVVTHQHIKVLNAHIGIINDIVVSPSGNFLFTASYDHTVQLWDLVKLLPVQILSRHEGSVNCMTLRGDMLFTGSEDQEIKVYLYYQGLASKNLMVV
ncbi:E3 ubiquitin-protein ligase TRAF7 isoform X2 [Hydra vulgaris]|uniref:E3 ubiquitin-protein ligase TRAF7 isoform X2 n=1 Tax=Hydra vulgaris TaxID=6087 RepID=A0ABM4BLZ2_HYDVU